MLDSIQAPSLKYLAFSGPIFASKCRQLETLKLHVMSKLEPFVEFLTTHSSSFDSVRHLEPSHTNVNDSTNADGTPVQGLRHAPPSATDAARIVLIFSQSEPAIIPQLRHLHLTWMAAPAVAVADLLQARRDTELGVQRLASCMVTELLSQYRELSEDALKQRRVRSARLRTLGGSNSGRRPNGSLEDAVRSYTISFGGIRISSEASSADNRRLTWAEGLEREPE